MFYDKIGEVLGQSATNIISSVIIALLGAVLILVGYRILRKFLGD